MISPLEIHHAARRWGCGWFVAWTRLRCRRDYWSAHTQPAERAQEASASARRRQS